MNKIGIIIRREYLRRVRQKSFLLLTLLMPFLMAALILLPAWMSSIKSSEVRTVAVIDQTGKYAPLFKDDGNFRFVSTQKSLDDYRRSPDKSLAAILNITADLLENPSAATLYSDKQIPPDLNNRVNQVLTKELENEKLASFNIPNLKEIIRESKVNFSVQTIKWDANGSETHSSAQINSIIGFVLTLLIYIFILSYGAMVMQGVLEEKTQRIVELMISSVKPFDLMMGKIIGIALVGLTQLFIWGVLFTGLMAVAGLFMGGGDAKALLDAASTTAGMDIPAGAGGLFASNQLLQQLAGVNYFGILVAFLLYFIGGYLLYASLFAAIGSSVDQQEDTQQFMMPVTLLIVFAFIAGISSTQNPDSPLAFWCSMIPFTSPVVMMVRLPFDVPLWQEALSIGLLFATALAITWLSAKIYRTGILMYGKKPDFRELLKWLRYK
ncbi:MAG: ABC transporter permease [Tannerella sp.]|nr:ABC transporter permease [Tannerella sp.]